MKLLAYITRSDLQPFVASAMPVREADAVLSSRAQAQAANQLTTGDQLNKFWKELRAHDSGNQPA
jgi:hypothetical protein